jgi:transcriptional regulator with XRE-family HTH domain
MSSGNGIIYTMKDRILRQFGDNVKRLRKKKGWSQEELAKRAGLHRTYIGSIERSERNVSLINIERIAKALSLRIRDLIDK